MRKHLNAAALLGLVRTTFENIPDPRRGRSSGRGGSAVQHSLTDTLMCALAVFKLKFPSLLAFDRAHQHDARKVNLERLFKVETVPSDSQLAAVLDEVHPDQLRPVFSRLFAAAQRGKLLEPMSFIDGHYLVALDGTGHFSSGTVNCIHCCCKTRRNGKKEYYHQLLGAALIHPDQKTVLPLCPEPITREDGASKNDCERNATRRWLDHFRSEHPNLPVIVVEDGLASNGPHIRDLQHYDCNYILGAKPGDHKALFEEFEQALTAGEGACWEEQDPDDPRIKRHFRILNRVALNKSHTDLEVNVLECREVKEQSKGRPPKTTVFSWVTDIELTTENAHQMMRGGRARWKIENETFNTLKNHGYNLEHNYGHGNKYLASVFGLLTMLAFLIDQIEEMSCADFKTARDRTQARYALWEQIRALFSNFVIDNWTSLYQYIANQHQMASLPPLPEINDTS